MSQLHEDIRKAQALAHELVTLVNAIDLSIHHEIHNYATRDVVKFWNERIAEPAVQVRDTLNLFT